MKQQLISNPNFSKLVVGASGIGLVSILLFVIFNLSLSVLIFTLVFFLLGVFLTWSSGKELIQVFSLGYFLSIFLSLIIYLVYTSRYSMPYFLGGSDDLHFELDAQRIVDRSIWVYDRESLSLAIGNVYHNSLGYVYFLSHIIRIGDFLGGYNTMMPRIINCFLLGISGVLVGRIAIQIGLGKRYSLIAGLWTILFPMMIFTTIHVFRDNLTLIILLITLYFTLKISFHPKAGISYQLFLYTIPVLIFLPFIFQLRLVYTIPIVLMLLSAWIFKIIPLVEITNKHLMVFVPLFFCLYLILERVEIFQTALKLKSYYDSVFAGGEQSDFGGLSNLLFNLPQPFQTVARFAYSIITPLPKIYPDIEWTVLGFASIIQLFYSLYVILGIKILYKQIKFLPLIIGFSVIFISYFTGTFTFRHITQWFPFAVLIGLFGYINYNHLNKKIFISCLVLFVIGGVVYTLIKFA